MWQFSEQNRVGFVVFLVFNHVNLWLFAVCSILKI